MFRLECNTPTKAVDIATMCAVQKVGYDRANAEQGRAICEFLLSRDVFMSLPTGEGKSLCYESLPLVFGWLRECYTSHSIVLVVGAL